MPEDQLQLSLPYEEITAVASRDYLRKNPDIAIGKKVSYTVPFNKLLIREGFNERKVYEGIEELADSIYTHGQITEFDIDVLPDGRFFIFRGHRRHRAYQLLIEQGKFAQDGLVSFFPTSKSLTEQDRMIDQWVSNNLSKKNKPLEQAAIANNIKYNFGTEKSNEQVAVLMGNISRQTVDNLISLAIQPDDVKKFMSDENFSISQCLAYVKTLKKHKKDLEKSEKDAGQTSMSKTPLPKDMLADEMKELADANLQGEVYEQRQREKERKEQERLERDAVFVTVSKDELAKHIGKRLAAPAFFIWKDDFTDQTTGETITVSNEELVLKQGIEITENIIEELLHKKVESVYIYKEIRAAESVITQAREHEEKSKFDESRPEISQVQNCIKLADKLEAIVNKLDAPDGTKKDVADIVKWMQYDLDQLRTWIHSNKKQNKRGS